MKSKLIKNQKPNYDLEERTSRFGEDIIDLCKKAPKNTITTPIISQLIRSGTSIGANYCEANGASSKKDFKNKIFTCKKESKETKYWLRMLVRTAEELKDDCRKLWQEAQEFTLIFSKIAINTKSSD
ncbi:MAG: four helix bundle protein [Candidatus Levybacteria bacterium]|nr:four helix bundle protein [Candidatus Levybacteria bacterium]